MNDQPLSEKIRGYVTYYGRFCLFFYLFAGLLTGAELPVEGSSCITFGGGYTFLQQGKAGGNLGEFQTSCIYQSVGQCYSGVTLKLEEGSIESSERKKRLLDIDAQGRLGYTFGRCDQKWIASLFSGLGYRYLNEKETWFGISFYSSHNDLYIPAGLFVEWEIASRLRLGILGQWRPQVYPAMTISSRRGYQWITKRKLGNFLVEVPLKVKVYSKYQMHLLLKPFLDFWQEGRTVADFKAGFPLPQQTFLFIGIDASLSVNF